MAQLVEQLTRNEQVTGSSPVNGSMNSQRPASQRAFSYLRLVALYDVVIVGAGAAGVPAAISAKEAGATVALIQKEATAISQGNTATGILLDGSDPRGRFRSGVHAAERAPIPR